MIIVCFKSNRLKVIVKQIIFFYVVSFTFGGITFMIIAILVVLVADLFFTNTQSKWVIFSAVMVPVLMQSNLSPFLFIIYLLYDIFNCIFLT